MKDGDQNQNSSREEFGDDRPRGEAALRVVAPQGHFHVLSSDQVPRFDGDSDSETSDVLGWFHCHIFSLHWMIINDQVAPNPRQDLFSSLKLSLFMLVVDCLPVLQVEAKWIIPWTDGTSFLSTVVG